MSFPALGLDDVLVERLAALGIVEPSPVQRVAVPAVLGGANIVAVAQTGSGKTYAYGAPMLQRLRAEEDARGVVTVAARPRAVVLTSTRELVVQTTRALKSLAHGVKQRIRGVAGGMLPSETRRVLADPFDVLVANPPRLATLLREGLVTFEDVVVLVVDEADTLLSPGQRGDVERILDAVPASAQRVYASATLPEPIRSWLTRRPEKPSILLSRDAHATPSTVRFRVEKVRDDERADATWEVIHDRPKQRGIVFTNRRETADAAGQALRDRGATVIVAHGGMLPRERKAAIDAFRRGEAAVLVTTELAGRGLHVEDLDYVVNWELPERASDYVHRVGRVGRQGRRGEVINLVGARDMPLLGVIERLAKGGRLDTGEPLRTARERPAPQGGDGPRRGGGRSGRRRRD